MRTARFICTSIVTLFIARLRLPLILAATISVGALRAGADTFTLKFSDYPDGTIVAGLPMGKFGDFTVIGEGYGLVYGGICYCSAPWGEILDSSGVLVPRYWMEWVLGTISRWDCIRAVTFTNADGSSFELDETPDQGGWLVSSPLPFTIEWRSVTVTEINPPVHIPLSCSVAVSTLWPPNGKFVDVGLTANKGTALFEVFSNEDDPSIEEPPPDPITLSATRRGNGQGRVYLIVAYSPESWTPACCTVVVPKDASAESLHVVNAMAADAKAYFDSHGGEFPPGYSLVVTH